MRMTKREAPPPGSSAALNGSEFIALLVVVLLLCLFFYAGRKVLRSILVHRLLLGDGGHAQGDSLVSTLAWQYEDDEDETKGSSNPKSSPRSPRLLTLHRASSRRLSFGNVRPEPKLRRRDSAPLTRNSFVGTWKIESQQNRDELLQAVDMPYLIRKAVQVVDPPNQTLFFDNEGVMHCHTGPLFNRYMEERFEEGPPAEHSFRGMTSLTEYYWVGSVLHSTVRTIGQKSLARNRRWVAPMVPMNGADASGDGECKMVVVNEYWRDESKPDEKVVYTRTYTPVPS